MRRVLVSILFACIAWRTAVAADPQQNQLDASKSLFAVLAAINVAGYDAEINSPSNHPLRAQLRDSIAPRGLKSVRELTGFFKEHRKDNWNDELSQYVSYALSVDGPPEFKWRYSTDRTPPAANALEAIGPLLKDFWTEANLEQAWKAAQPAYDEIIARYHAPVSEAILQSNMYLRNPTSGSRGRRFQIYVDLLGAPNQVHTRSFTDDYFVVITPSQNLRVNDVRRAYLHYLIDPVTIRRDAEIEKKKALCQLAEGAPALSELYKHDCELQFGMSLVRAVESRLDHNPAEVDEAMREGFVLTAYFAEALVGYEKQEVALRLDLADMINAINVKSEDKRIAAVAFNKAPVQRVVKVEQQVPAASPVEKQLDDIDKLVKAHDLDAAREACRKVLEEGAPNPLHARAYFNLAKIAALEKNPELSQQLFQKTLGLDPAPFEKAWAHVYLARLAMNAEEFDDAVTHYAAALEVTGASEQARQAAQKEMEAAKSHAQQK